MNVTRDVVWNGAFGPAPISDRPGEEFELAALSREAASNLTVDVDAHQAAPIRIAVRTGNRHDIRGSRLRRAREYAAEFVFPDIVELFLRYGLLVKRANFLRDFKRTIAPHEFERRQILGRGFFRQTRN